MNRAWVWVAEQFSTGWTGLRSSFRTLATTFWPSRSPYDRTVINYELARQLYRNDGADTRLGAGFCRPIIDRTVEFMGIPQIAGDNEGTNQFLNTAIQQPWKSPLQQIFRDALRDSKTVVRVWQPSVRNKLVTEEERQMCRLEIIDPQRVKLISFDPFDPEWIEKAVIVSYVPYPDPNTDTPNDPPAGARVKLKEHEIWEIITPESFTYFDKTENRFMEDKERPNPYEFVPICEVFNEYDATISGGQSDFEPVYPFIKAFHEVMLQTLKAHKYHSTPKLQFKVKDVANFLQNNFPDTVDENGNPVPGAVIKWEGREILFTHVDEELGFLEAKSVLGDSRTLLEFLIDCIAVASEMPEEMFMRQEAATSGQSDKKFLAYERKIERKRTSFNQAVVQICKMALLINDRTPDVGEVLWDEIQIESLVSMAQATQQLVMSLEVLLQRKIISERTAMETIRGFRLFRRMKPPEQEAQDAKGNLDLEEHTAEIQAKFSPSPNGQGSSSRVPPVTGRPVGGRNE
jgi:hypothetical protein